jgi:O-methyltransferase
MMKDDDFSTYDFSDYASVIVHGMFMPFLKDEAFKALHATVPRTSPIKLWSYYFLYQLVKQSLSVEGDFFECGVFKGGSASFIAKLMEGSKKNLHLFDTFAGMPKCDPELDPVHVEGDFADVSLDEARAAVGHEDFVVFHQGKIPDTFEGMEDCRIAFAHVDVDIYTSMLDCCEFIYPRLTRGGVMLLDDYGHVTCPGARRAADKYLSGMPSVPIPLYTGQAIVVKV